MQKDKKQHILALFAITLGAAIVTKDALKAAIIGIVIGFGKEVYDYYFGGVASVADMAANFIGITAAILLYIAIQETICKRKETE